MFAYYFLFSALCVLLDNAANFNLGCFFASLLYSAEYLLLYADGALLVLVALGSKALLAVLRTSPLVVPSLCRVSPHLGQYLCIQAPQLSLAVDCIAIAIQSVVESLTTLHLIRAVTNTSFAPIAVPADTAVKNNESFTTKKASDNAAGP